MIYKVKKTLLIFAVIVFGASKSLVESSKFPIQCGNLRLSNYFPWLAALEYRTPNGTKSACGGVLINKRYVLTAAHCLMGKHLPAGWKLVNVRIGFWDSLSNLECASDETSDDKLCVGIEERIVHEGYASLSNDHRHDIALLRLNRDLNNIQPACLPSIDYVGSMFQVGGWGLLDLEINQYYTVRHKSTANLTFVDEQQCWQKYHRRGVTLAEGQICARGHSRNDMCTGDSGGPLMEVKRWMDFGKQWTVVGIMAFASSPCDGEISPIIYNKVFNYLSWIDKNVKA